jgi:hypothetical protein
VGYATIQDCRDEGITTPQASDSRLTSLLASAVEFIDSVTQQWFEPRTKTLTLDGPGTDTLLLYVPILSITSVTLDGAALSLSDLAIYNGPDDRGNPKIVRKAGWGGRRVWAGLDAGPPQRGRRRLLRLLRGRRGLDAGGDPRGDDPARGAGPRPPGGRRGAGRAAAGEIFMETTDGHSYQLGGALAGTAGAWRRNGLTGDPAIDTILMRYRRPAWGGGV